MSTADPSRYECGVAARMADEGVPIAAIARVLSIPFADVSDILHEELLQGNILEVPRADWPPGVKIRDHLPTIAITRKTSNDDIAIVCRKMFKLTNLEAGFVVLLLKVEHATKEKLHNVIETQRAARASRPDNMEMTDQKMVDVIICKLRKKLKLIDPEFIISTVWAGGYYIELPVKEKLYARLATEGVSLASAPNAASDVHAGHSAVSGV